MPLSSPLSAAATAAQTAGVLTPTPGNGAPLSTVLTNSQTVQTPPPSPIPFDGAGEGVILPPPAYVDGRYRWFTIISGNNMGFPVPSFWYDVTPQMLVDYTNAAIAYNQKLGYASGAPLTLNDAIAKLQRQAVYPPDLPLLQITLDKTNTNPRLCWYDYPETNATGMSFINSSAWTQGYDVNGNPTTGAEAIEGLFWMYTYIQAYLDKFLNSPYDFTALVPYGFNYWDELRTKYNTLDTIEQYLSNVNYLTAPTGHATFWDGVLNAAPLVIIAVVGTAFTIASAGAVSPLFVAAFTAVFKKAVSTGQAIRAADAAQLSAPATIANASGVNATNIATTVGTQALENPVANPSIFIFIVVLVLVFLLMVKEK